MRSIKMQNIFLASLTLLFIAGCKATYLKFDPNPPGEIPEVFAKDIIAKNNEHVGYCAFSPDGSELYYAVTTNDWFPSRLVRVSASKLTHKDTLYLKDKMYEGEPFITRDGNTLYFMAVSPPAEGAQWHADLYKVKKTPNGWCSPEPLDSVINSNASEWHISMTDNNVMYFTSEREKGTNTLHGDIYRVTMVDGKFINRTKLSSPINTEFNDSDPLIAPDESFLIFHSDRPGGFGEHDLYISFNNENKWTDPVNMGQKINTEAWEMAPSLTPDGKYLLFTRRKAMKTTESAKIYWVSTRIFKKYR